MYRILDFLGSNESWEPEKSKIVPIAASKLSSPGPKSQSPKSQSQDQRDLGWHNNHIGHHPTPPHHPTTPPITFKHEGVLQEKGGKILSRVNTIVKSLKREKGSCEEIFWAFDVFVKPSPEVPKSKVPKPRPKGLGLTLKSHGPPTPGKKCKKWKLLRMTPLTHPAKKIDQMDSENKDVG